MPSILYSNAQAPVSQLVRASGRSSEEPGSNPGWISISFFAMLYWILFAFLSCGFTAVVTCLLNILTAEYHALLLKLHSQQCVNKATLSSEFHYFEQSLPRVDKMVTKIAYCLWKLGLLSIVFGNFFLSLLVNVFGNFFLHWIAKLPNNATSTPLKTSIFWAYFQMKQQFTLS